MNHNLGIIYTMHHTATLGIIAAPGWLDPTCRELECRFGPSLRTAQTILGPGNFDYSFAAIEQSKAALCHAVLQLAHAQCDLIIQVGPAFAYLLGKNMAGCRALDDELSALAGVPVITNGTAVLDALTHTGSSSLMLGCPYYNGEWRTWIADFFEQQGFSVAGICGFIDAGVFPDQASIDARHYRFSDQELYQCIAHASQQAPLADALLVCGSGVRVNALPQWPAHSQRHLISADSALANAAQQVLIDQGFKLQPPG